ncbi:hypothetical protein [Micromonospora sp. 4G55]|nr:hypothetical protein [Micromonospora sp. 4G55]
MAAQTHLADGYSAASQTHLAGDRSAASPSRPPQAAGGRAPAPHP